MVRIAIFDGDDVPWDDLVTEVFGGIGVDRLFEPDVLSWRAHRDLLWPASTGQPVRPAIDW